MSSKRKVLVAGLKPNKTVRALYRIQVGHALFNSALLVLLATVLGGESAAFTICIIAFVIPLNLVWAGTAIWALNKYSDITVLMDGLDVAGRFVSFADINAVHLIGSNRIKIEYKYHGVTMTAWIGTANFIGSLNTLYLVKELQTVSGVEPELQSATAVTAATA